MRTIARTVRSRAPGRSDVYTGRGKRTRIAPFTKLDGVDGARLIVAVDPHTALTVGVAAMSTNRFTPGTAELQQKLTASGSPWIGQDLRIGNSRSTGRSLPYARRSLGSSACPPLSTRSASSATAVKS